MALINLIPGMGGQVGSLINDSISLLEDAASCGPENPFSCFLAVIDLALVIFDVFQEFFPTRPKVGKDSASDDTALFFIPSLNPIIALWGIGIRDLETQGIPTSASGGTGYTANLNLANAVLNDLRKQFDGAGAPKLTLAGIPATGDQVFAWYHLLGFQTNHPDSNATAIQERVKVDNLYRQLEIQKWIDPLTGFPFKQPPPPPNPCPAGQHWDAALGKCVPNPPPPPQKCPSGQHWDAALGKCVPNAPPPPQPSDPDQDELQDCCDETQQALANLYGAIASLSVGSGDQLCCANIVAAIMALTAQVTAVAKVISNPGPTPAPIDLTPIVNELAALVASVNAFETPSAELRATIDSGLQGIRAAIAAQPPPDLREVIGQLRTIAQQGDVKQSVLDYLVQQGFMTGADAQVISGASWADAIVGLFRTAGWRALVWMAGIMGVDITGKTLRLNPLGRTVAHDITEAIDVTLDVGAVPLYAVVTGALDGIVSLLRPARAVQIGDVGVDDALLLAKTLGPVLIVNAVAMVTSFFDIGGGEVLAKWTEAVAGFTGFEEIKEIQVGARMRFGPMRVAEMNARREYRQELPGANQLYSLAARGLLAIDRAAALNGYNGIPDELHAGLQHAAFSGIAPRQLLRLMNTGLFTDADYQDELTFAGIRPASQHRFLLAAPYLATATERTQLRAEIEKGYGAGLLSDQELVQMIDSAEHNTSRDFLILDKVRMTERIAIAAALEKEYTTSYKAGLLTHDAYVANLSGMGLQNWKVNTLAGIADANRAATLARQMAAAERALERATAAAERKAAMKAYQTGTVDIVGLTAALVSTGLTAVQAAAWAELAVLEKQGNLRWVYGLQLSPEQATILKERVTALTDQVKKELIPMIEYVRQLRALNISGRWLNALEAAAAAHLAGKGQAFRIPVSTS